MKYALNLENEPERSTRCQVTFPTASNYREQYVSFKKCVLNLEISTTIELLDDPIVRPSLPCMPGYNYP